MWRIRHISDACLAHVRIPTCLTHGHSSTMLLYPCSRVPHESITRPLARNIPYIETRCHLNDLLAQEDFWEQQAKCHWLVGGDSNSRFFHAMASARKQTNRIECIQDGTGTWVTKQQDLCIVARDYFTSVFEADPIAQELNLSFIHPTIPSEENNSLLAPFSMDEFRVAVFKMHLDKSPGPDGFNPAFYKKLWTLVGEDVFNQCSKWLQELQFPSALNRTNILLIPKCSHPTSMKDLRPIALCNVMYKIMTKVLGNRIKNMLPHIMLI